MPRTNIANQTPQPRQVPLCFLLATSQVPLQRFEPLPRPPLAFLQLAEQAKHRPAEQPLLNAKERSCKNGNHGSGRKGVRCQVSEAPDFMSREPHRQASTASLDGSLRFSAAATLPRKRAVFIRPGARRKVTLPRDKPGRFCVFAEPRLRSPNSYLPSHTRSATSGRWSEPRSGPR